MDEMKDELEREIQAIELAAIESKQKRPLLRPRILALTMQLRFYLGLGNPEPSAKEENSASMDSCTQSYSLC